MMLPSLSALRLIAIAAALALSAAAGAWMEHQRGTAQLAKLQARWDTERAALAQASADATRKALDQTNAMQREVEHAQQNARKDQAVAAATGQRLRAELDGLRQQLDAADRADRAMPADSCTAEREGAATARQLLGACAQRYSDLAAETDGIAIELNQVLAAWPRNTGTP